MLGIDAVLDEEPGGLFDIRFNEFGDIETRDYFDTAIKVSLFADARAPDSDVVVPQNRRGWAGNEYTPGQEMGGLLWVPLLHGRINRSTMNAIEDRARSSLQWLVDQAIAVSIVSVEVRFIEQGRLGLAIAIERSPSQIERRYFELWSQTGVPDGGA